MNTLFELRQIEQSCGEDDFLEIKIFEDGSRGGYRHEVKLGEKLFYSGCPHQKATTFLFSRKGI